MIRGFEEQFKRETIDKIQNLLQRIEDFSLPKGVSRYYAVDLSLCLKAGALLGALHVASSLLEIVVREMVIERASETFSDIQKERGRLQQKLEEKRNISFKKLVSELATVGLFSESDADLAKTFYDNVRIPIHHGLPARFVGTKDNSKSLIDVIFGFTTPTEMRNFEKVIENNALLLVETAIGIIERNSR